MVRPAPSAQLDLLAWEPPAAVARFDEERVRSATLAGKITRGVAEALRQSGRPREHVAAAMGDFLGEAVSKNMLDAYASEARVDHVITLPRFIALLHVTQDRRLLELLAEMFGWAVIDRKFLRLIEIASLQEREDELRRKREALRRDAKSSGVL